MRLPYPEGERVLVLSSRPVALFRILFSLLLLKDAVYRLFVVDTFYSDDGVVPRQALWDGLARDSRFSLMDWLPASWMAVLFFLVWIAVLVALLVGWRARLMAILNFILILSIHERNVYILTGADTAMRVFSFWLMFAPVSEYYALDAARPKIAPTFLSHTLPITVMRVQFATIYLVTGYLKAIEGIWTRGEALHYVLQLESILLLPGRLLKLYAPDTLLTLITLSVIVVELSLPVLLLSPFGQPRLRSIGIVIGALLHIGIGLTLAIPDFSLVMLVGYTLFFQPEWVSRIARQVEKVFVTVKFSNSVRYSARPYREETRHALPFLRWLNLIAIPLLLLVVWWNIEATREYQETFMPPLPEGVEDVMWLSGLWQYWDLFAPVPYQIDGRLLVEGRFENGIRFDLFTEQPVNVQVQSIQFGPLMRWKKFEEVIFRNQYPQILEAWGDRYCRLYNEEMVVVPGTLLEQIDIAYVYRRSHPPQEQPNEIQHELMWTHHCLSERVDRD
jgi:hypothetical protein